MGGHGAKSPPFFFEYQIQLNMKKLTLNEKQIIVRMLNKHYTIDPAAIVVINMAADNAEQMTELTLKAFSMVGKPKNDAIPHYSKPTASNFPYSVIKIDNLGSKLQLVKAIRDITQCNFKEAKRTADAIVTAQYSKYIYNRFVIGPKGIFSVLEWERISKKVNEECELEWHCEETTFKTK